MTLGSGNASRHLHNDSRVDMSWPEVKFINNYAVFMGYLSMAVTGTGLLVFTWSTVVLLGGYVTKLATEDFWSLTVITLVQTRVFDIFLKGNISNIGYSFTRLGKAALDVALSRKLCSGRGMIRLLVFTILLCPLFALYMFGLFVSPWISLWRLWRTVGCKDSYRMASGEMANLKKGEMANLKPALLVLYSLALLQGLLFYYWAVSKSEEKRLVKRVVQAYDLDDKDSKARKSVSDYLHEIRMGCEKDPSYARGRNLIAYAVDLMESNSPSCNLSGARILDMVIQQLNSPEERQRARISSMVASASSNGISEARVFTFTVVNLPENVVESQRMLINNMIGSASSSDAIKKLIRMLDTKNPADPEIRLRAMRIVAYFAREIRLDKIMYGVDNISSLLKHEENDESEKYLVYCTGMKILSDLAKDDENFKVMNNTDGITKNIVMAIANFDQLHRDKHDDWMSIALPAMRLIKRFVSATSKPNNNVKHRNEILTEAAGIDSFKEMVDCQQCKGHTKMQKSIIQALTGIISTGKDLSDQRTDESDKSEGRRNEDHIKEAYKQLKDKFIRSLVVMFLHGSGKNSFKTSAGESLVKLLKQSDASSATSILRAEVGVADVLTKAILDGQTKYKKWTAQILGHLCKHYKHDDNNKDSKNLRDAIIRDIPQVLNRLLDSSWQDDGYRGSYYSRAFNNHIEMQEALLSLCVTANEIVLRPCPPSVQEQVNRNCQEIFNERSEVSLTGLLKEAEDKVNALKKQQRDSEQDSDEEDDSEDDIESLDSD